MSSAPRWRWAAWAAWVMAAAALAAVGVRANLERADDRDASLYVLYGKELARGSRLYADLWDVKPPGIYWLNATGRLGTRALCAAAVGAAVAALWSIARRLHGPAIGKIAAVLGAVFIPFYTLRTGSNRPETFVTAADLACVALALAGLRRRGCLLAAGACAGMSAVFKQTGLAAFAGVMVLLVVDRVSWRDTLRRLAAFAGGWLAVVGAAVGILAVGGILDDAWEACVVFPTSQRPAAHVGDLLGGARWMWRVAGGLGLPMLLAAAALIGGVVRPDRLCGTPASQRVLLPAVWLVAALILALVSPLRHEWFLAPAMAPLLLLSVEGLRRLLAEAAAIRRGARGLRQWAAAVAILALAYMLTTSVATQWAAAKRTQRQQATARAEAEDAKRVEAIRTHSSPTDRMFVFGYMPELYLQAERSPAIRYVGTLNVTTWADQNNDLLPRIAALLEASPPRILVGDPPRPASGDEEARRAESFAAWRKKTYTEVDEGVWVRRSQARESP